MKVTGRGSALPKKGEARGGNTPVKVVASNNGCYASLSDFHKHELRGMRAELNIRPQSRLEGVRLQPYKIYKEDKDTIILPRHWASQHVDLEVEFEYAQMTTINIRWDEQLCRLCTKKRQDEQVECVMRGMRSYYGGVLSVPCGYGKTTVALHIASRLACRTIIVVHKEFLMHQWIDRIHSLYPDCTIGRIQGDTMDTNADFVVAMLQTLAKRAYTPSLFRSIGFAIFDECHLVSTQHFSRALMSICCKHVLGLSATPHRPDGTWCVIEHFLGPVLFQCDRSNDAKCVDIDYVNSGVAVQLQLNKKGNVNFAQMINDLCSHHERNSLLLNAALRCIKNGHKLLILTDRREHVQALVELLSSSGVTASEYLGGMKQGDLEISSQSQAIVATFPMASTGLDIPSLSALLLATPHVEIEQAVGRIMRAEHDQHLVIDVVDDMSVTYCQWRKRKTWYRKQGYQIRTERDRPDGGAPATQAFGFLD